MRRANDGWRSDTAMALDPRIARLKQEEKERKAREKESKRQGGAAKDTNAAAAAEAKKVQLICQRFGNVHVPSLTPPRC